MKGAFYYDKALKTLNYVAVWPQEKPDGTVKAFARVISLSDSPKSAASTAPMSGAKAAPKAQPKPLSVAPCDKCGKTQ
ncbi:MAG TPA: hypothetical protein VLC46_10285 [Thermoanaerobaculia bacterium]|jgi:hypothetical protein|nr:hypothetical protein [Thermoanaerobaculia bacterium]